MTRTLPPRPSPAHLKKQAKQLLKQFRDADNEALEQIRLYFPSPDQFNTLRDAQLVVARAYGYSGWTDLLQAVDERLLNSLDPAELADRFVDLACLQYNGQDSDLRLDHAQRILQKTPELAEHNFITAVISNQFDLVQRSLKADPSLASTVAGPRQWPPLLYLAYSRIRKPGNQQNAIQITRQLLDHGADPNAYIILNNQYRFTVLTGIMGEGEGGIIHQPPHPYAQQMARLLLDAGANPNECQGLYNTAFTESEDSWLKLLVEYGLDRDSTLTWNPEIRTFDFLLEMAVRRNFPSRVEYLLQQGADPNVRGSYSRHKVYTLALTGGHDEIAGQLLNAGATPEELSPEDRSR